MNRVIPGSLVILSYNGELITSFLQYISGNAKHVAVENHSKEFFIYFNFIAM